MIRERNKNTVCICQVLLIVIILCMLALRCCYVGSSQSIYSVVSIVIAAVSMIFMVSMYSFDCLLELKKQVGLKKSLASIVLNILCVLIAFATIYFYLYSVWENSFSEVIQGPPWKVFLDFVSYSMGITFSANITEIKTVSIIAKTAVCAQVLLFFIYLALIANIFFSSQEQKKKLK